MSSPNNNIKSSPAVAAPPAAAGMSVVNTFCLKTVNELKQLCKDKGLKVSGNKEQLVDRLTNPTVHKKNKPAAMHRAYTVAEHVAARRARLSAENQARMAAIDMGGALLFNQCMAEAMAGAEPGEEPVSEEENESAMAAARFAFFLMNSSSLL